LHARALSRLGRPGCGLRSQGDPHHRTPRPRSAVRADRP